MCKFWRRNYSCINLGIGESILGGGGVKCLNHHYYITACLWQRVSHVGCIRLNPHTHCHREKFGEGYMCSGQIFMNNTTFNSTLTHTFTSTGKTCSSVDSIHGLHQRQPWSAGVRGHRGRDCVSSERLCGSGDQETWGTPASQRSYPLFLPVSAQLRPGETVSRYVSSKQTPQLKIGVVSVYCVITTLKWKP